MENRELLMSEVAAGAAAPHAEVAPYTDSWDHLYDEIKRLNLLIQLQVVEQTARPPAGPLDQFKGLVLSESEIAGLLAKLSAPPAGRGDQYSNEEGRKLRSALAEMDARIERRLARSHAEGVYLSLPHLAESFHLNEFEQRCLVACLAPELDRDYEKLYAYLQDDVTRKKPGVGLILDLLLDTTEEKLAARASFDPHAPLLKYRLLQLIDNSVDNSTPLISRFLKLDGRVVDFLLETGRIDARTRRVAQPAVAVGASRRATLDEAHGWVRDFVRSHIAEGGAAGQNLIFYLHGAYGSGKVSLAEAVADDLGMGLLLVDTEKLLEGPLDFEDMLWLLGREAMLEDFVLCFENFDLLLADPHRGKSRVKALAEMARECLWLVFLSGARPWRPQGLFSEAIFMDLSFPIPDDSSRKSLWEAVSSRGYALDGDVDLDALASKFRFTQGQIRDALAAAQSLARRRSADARIGMGDLYAACRAQSSAALGTLARKVEAIYTWDDIVLPEDLMTQLLEICQRVVHRSRVLGEWGFASKLSMGKGVNALFAGPSGTGKSMATEIIANELGLDLYKIDLSGVVSKYIGETEKNLDRVFAAAEDSNAILFFDEADALFGKRSEVRDSHDRYANIEISYLLQKMEEYEGLAILATNLRANLDESFVRRLAFTIHFPFPDRENRRRIWERIWPTETILDDTVDLDFLARQFKLSGGNIKNIALAAAFLAAEDGGRVSMSHLIHATKREYQKLGKPLSPSELGQFATPEECASKGKA